MQYIDFLKKNTKNFYDPNGNYLFSNDKIDIENDCTVKEKDLDKKEETKIHRKLLPQPVIGDLKKGKIFICSLNPGFGDKNYEDEKVIHGELLKQLRQENPSMFWLKNEFEGTGGGGYWRNKLNQKDKKKSLVMEICRGYKKVGEKITDEDINKVFNWLSEKMVALELFPYHSKRMKKSLLKKCKNENKNGSVDNMLRFVHEELIPNAQNNNQIICFTRSIRDWSNWTVNNEKIEIENLNNPMVFYNDKNHCQNITYNVTIENGLGEFILKYICKRTNGFNIPLDDI